MASFRIYLNDIFLCESTPPTDGSITCEADLIDATMTFSMTTVDSAGTESSPSNILVFNPADYPDIFIWQTATFSWEYDSSTTSVSGFKILNNDKTICETDDPSARQYTCKFLVSDNNSFSILAIADETTVSTNSNIITYSYTPTTSTSPSTEPLLADFTVSAQEGEAPFGVEFDATSSTGDITSFTWMFGDGETANGQTTTYTYQFSGTYTTTLTVTDSLGFSQQKEINIAVLDPTVDPPTTLEPPTAVISSSSAIGEAPYTVDFSGSGSITEQPPITLYSWSFGDGATAIGETTSHMYTIPGTYQANLTITDSSGLTGQVSTPVIVNEPAVAENVTPTPQIVATPLAGVSPLTVSFDASASTDPDGNITNYTWSFGDGTSATGTTTLHSYNEAADYTATLTVTDDKAASASTSQAISVLASDNSTFYFELWEVQVDHNWTRIDFDQPFIDPVIISGPPGNNETDPAITRIRNVTSSGFEIRLQEWEYLDGSHGLETLAFIVVDKGTYTLEDGTKVEAGTFSGSASSINIALQQSYDTTPVILTQVMSNNKPEAVTGRIDNINLSSFNFLLQEQESTRTEHTEELVGYIAWEPGVIQLADLPFEVGTTPNSITHKWFDLNYQSEFTALPLFLGRMQTMEGGDTSTIRFQNPSKSAIQLKIEEESSKDAETNHTKETIGYIAIGAPSTPPSSTTPAEDETTPEAAVEKQLTLSWDYSGTAEIDGFRFYLNGLQIGESMNPSDRAITLNISLVKEIMQFTMTAIFPDGSESSHSSILQIDPADYPQLFGTYLATFKWDYTTGTESSIAGFRIFNNDVELCSTSTSSDRELTCEIALNDIGNTFTMKAILSDGTDTSASNALVY